MTDLPLTNADTPFLSRSQCQAEDAGNSVYRETRQVNSFGVCSPLTFFDNIVGLDRL
ncbi:MAG: hypothetical protein ACJ8R9_21755 [Steroidobacteraceae bacterium]